MDKIKFHPTFFFLIECLTLLCHIMEVNWAAKAVSCSLIIMTAIFLKVSRNLILRLYFRLTTLYEEKICSLYLHFPDQCNFLISFFLQWSLLLCIHHLSFIQIQYRNKLSVVAILMWFHYLQNMTNGQILLFMHMDKKYASFCHF